MFVIILFINISGLGRYRIEQMVRFYFPSLIGAKKFQYFCVVELFPLA